MAVEIFTRRAQSIGLLMWSGIPETEGNIRCVPPTLIGGIPSSLTQSSEAPFITTVVTFSSKKEYLKCHYL